MSLFKATRVLSRNYAHAAAATATQQHAPPKKTPLYDLHVHKGGKMVDFTGWMMPLTYGNQSITDSHLHTRKHVSIFDVSHMQQLVIYGNDRFEFWETVCVSDVRDYPENSGALSLLTNEKGGIIDDTVWMNSSKGWLYVVLNAGCAEKDRDYLEQKAYEFKRRGKHATLSFISAEERALLAVQGPEMHKILQPGLQHSLEKLPFMHTIRTSLYGFGQCRITRCGYTGEDGVEISCLAKDALPLSEILLNSPHGKVQLAGLGARDSLRLEAGLCLYGNDIDETTTPVEAGLTWTIGKRRRQERSFPGADIIVDQIQQGVQRKRVGIVSAGAPLRKGYEIVDHNSEPVGIITSGCPSPSLGKNIAMGYVSTRHTKTGTELGVRVRGKVVPSQVVKMPFVPTQYYMPKGHA